MKNILLSSLCILIMIFITSSCGNNEHASSTTSSSTEEQKETIKETVPQNCIYQVNTNKTVVQWTAYKTSEKFPVKGIFENVAINSNKPNIKLPYQLILGTKFDISAMSVNSNNEERDKKLVKSFFQKVIPDMYGEFMTCEGDNNKGSGNIDMHWNGLKKSTPYNYTISNDTIYITTAFNLTDWKAESALAALNEVCKEKHTGKDGKSVTGKDVDVLITVATMKRCD